MKKKIFSLLVLLMTAVSGAWAQDTYKIDAVYTFTGGQSQSQDLSIADAASLPFTKKLSELDPNSISNVEYNLDATNITVSGDNIEKGTDANWDTEITINGAGTATVSYGIQHTVYGVVGSVTITFTVTKNAPASTTNYYLVGTMNDWGASKQFLLTPNPGNAAEYMITLNLKAGAEFKVIGVDGETTTWYPSGDNYYVNTAGQYTVYFRPDGQGGEGWHYGCIYLAPAPAPAVPITDLGSGQWQFQMPSYAVVAKIEYDTELELQEENVNTAVLEDWHGYEADVTLQRKLIAGSWNTLAVPFNVSSQMLGYLTTQYGLTVKQLASTSLENEGKTLMLNFENATEMVAGKPYLVKVTTDFDFSAQALPNVEVNKELNPVTTTYIDFIPTLGKTTIEGSDAKTVLYLGAGNKLYNPTALPTDMKGFRAYFLLHGDATAARSFELDFGDGETTSISEELRVKSEEFATVTEWYTLDGRKLQGQPTQKGVYIVNGKKTVIK